MQPKGLWEYKVQRVPKETSVLKVLLKEQQEVKEHKVLKVGLAHKVEYREIKGHKELMVLKEARVHQDSRRVL